MVLNNEVEETEDNYFKVLKIPSDSTVEDFVPNIMKRYPKRVAWAELTLHFNQSKDTYIVYEHDSRKVIRNRMQFALENFGRSPVTYACSNIDYNEYYYDIWVDEKITKRKTTKNTKKPLNSKVTKTSKQNIKVKKTVKKSTSLDYSKMCKAELKKILAERNVRVYYHDTLEILRDKCMKSER